MSESADPVRYLDVVHQSRQMSPKSSARGSSESCDCECGDGTTATDIDIFRSLIPRRQQWIPPVGEAQTVWMGFMMLILDAKGANSSGSRARSASVSREDFTLDSISANWSSGMNAWSIWDADDMVVVKAEKRGVLGFIDFHYETTVITATSCVGGYSAHAMISSMRSST
jgi:hypothetical protein